MTEYGFTTSFYAQKGINEDIDRVLVKDQQDRFKSKSHFINVAIVRFIKELDEKNKITRG